jgi:triacylglycerol lipase
MAIEPDQADRNDANTFTLRSVVTGPIAEMSLLRQSLLFAELSYISYMSRGEAGTFANEMGLDDVRFYDRDGAQAYVFGNEHDAVIVCRGTEPHEWNDIQADLDAVAAVAETVGHVHRGFKREVDDLWPRLEQALLSNERPLWFAGHSLGGAMAAICAGRCKLSHIPSSPAGLFTYGSPRVGDRRYVNHVRLNYYRWVNNNDIVPRVPPRWLGYRHAGQEIYLDNRGRMRNLKGWWRVRDRFHGFVKGLARFRIDHFSDHNLIGYIEGVWRAIEQEEPVHDRQNLAERKQQRRLSSMAYPHFVDHVQAKDAAVEAPKQN